MSRQRISCRGSGRSAQRVTQRSGASATSAVRLPRRSCRPDPVQRLQRVRKKSKAVSTQRSRRGARETPEAETTTTTTPLPAHWAAAAATHPEHHSQLDMRPTVATLPSTPH